MNGRKKRKHRYQIWTDAQGNTRLGNSNQVMTNFDVWLEGRKHIWSRNPLDKYWGIVK